MLAPLPRWQHDRPARGRARVELRQHRGDVLVGQAVEAVAAHARVASAPAAARRSARPAGCVRWNAVSKHATCGSSGAPLEQRADRREVVRLVQRRERHELLEPGDHVAVEPDRRGVMRSRRGRRDGRPPRAVIAPCVAREQVRSMCAIAPSWPSFAPSLPALLAPAARRRRPSRRSAARCRCPSIWPRTTSSSSAPRVGEERELDARRAGVEDEDRVGHGTAHADSPCRPRLLAPRVRHAAPPRRTRRGAPAPSRRGWSG